MKTRRHLLPVLLALLAAPLLAALPVQPVSHYEQVTRAEIYTDDNGTVLPYRLYVSPRLDPTRKYPLVLSLHGAGGRGTDNLKQLAQSTAGWVCDEVQAKHPCFILIPQCPTGVRWVDTPFRQGSYAFDAAPISDHFKAAKRLLDRIIAEYPIDRDRIYIMGCSMGGYATWNMIIRYPSLFAAAVPVCGAGDPGKAAALVSLPIWAFHGAEDDVVPPRGSTDMIDAIKKAGGTMAKITLYPGVKHESYNMAWRETELVEWLFAQSKRRKE
jgi:predicted peptidase